MAEQDDYAAWFTEHLPFVDKVIASVARHLGLRGADAEEFEWWVKERLWEDDYLVLRKWRGESRLTTYLTTVIANFGREFRVKQWGRWRPPAAAVRLGPIAVRLATLVHRDGLRLAEAAELLRTRGETTSSDRVLAELLAQIPAGRRGRRPGDDVRVPIETYAADGSADDPLLQEEDDAERDYAYRVLRESLRHLSAEERIIIQLHFLEGYSLADVARALDRE